MNQLALIFGGPSAEHDVSVVSAKNIFQVLAKTSIPFCLLGITRQRQWKLIDPQDLSKADFANPMMMENIGAPIEFIREKDSCFFQIKGSNQEKSGPLDCAFPIIHGPYGEDGQLQSELHSLGLPFVGTDKIGCELSFDKAKTKKIVSEIGVPQVPYLCFEGAMPEFKEVVEKLSLPFFIKPANMGSSIGISKVKSEADFSLALEQALIHDKKIVMEKGVLAREIECALLEENGEIRVSGVGEIKPNHDFYSYEAKYIDPNGAELIIPAPVLPEIIKEIQSMAKKCFMALQCRDYARADFFLTANNEIYFNEINTHPGFTNISQFPMLWKQEGLEYEKLIRKLIDRARHRSTHAL